MSFRSLGCTDPSTQITCPTVKMKTTSKRAESNYKIPHNNNQNPLQPTRSLRRGPSAWEMCGMNGKSYLALVEKVMRRTDQWKFVPTVTVYRLGPSRRVSTEVICATANRDSLPILVQPSRDHLHLLHPVMTPPNLPFYLSVA